MDNIVPIIVLRCGYIRVQQTVIMPTILTVILIAVGLVAFFVVGMSLTLIFKGHNIRSEISDNEHMRARGIKCAIQETRELDGTCDTVCGGDCSSCAPRSKDTPEA